MKTAIEIRNLNYSYPDGTEALYGINLDIFEGESVGIIGPNGAGKSTLLLHLNGILIGNSHIRIFDLEVNDKNLTQIRSKVGMVFQDPDNQLFMPTVFDDVAFGPINLDLKQEEVRRRVKKALTDVGMLDLAERVTHHLSYGEKKRISIATVLSMQPEILALDEPSGNLDPRARRQLIGLLKEFQLTKIIAAHDLELISDICQRVVILYEGKSVANGKTGEILGNKALMELYGLEVPLWLSLRDSI